MPQKVEERVYGRAAPELGGSDYDSPPSILGYWLSAIGDVPSWLNLL
jgi:hypothetical protein